MAVGLMLPGLGLEARGQASQTRTAAPSRPTATEAGVTWQSLTPNEQQFLAPLRRDWAVISLLQQRKWLELTTRVPTMSAEERSRIQARMIDWAKLTPEQRGLARLHYQEARQLPLRDRQARWDAYQSLSAEQKQKLAARASLAASATELGRRGGASGPHAEHSARDMPQPKSNIVPTPGSSTTPRQVAPTLLQARPGATTTPISKTAAPPAHQRSGMPKIAATPEYVNKSTLLPRRPAPVSSIQATAAASAPGVLPRP